MNDMTMMVTLSLTLAGGDAVGEIEAAERVGYVGYLQSADAMSHTTWHWAGCSGHVEWTLSDRASLFWRGSTRTLDVCCVTQVGLALRKRQSSKYVHKQFTLQGAR